MKKIFSILFYIAAGAMFYQGNVGGFSLYALWPYSLFGAATCWLVAGLAFVFGSALCGFEQWRRAALTVVVAASISSAVTLLILAAIVAYEDASSILGLRVIVSGRGCLIGVFSNVALGLSGYFMLRKLNLSGQAS